MSNKIIAFSGRKQSGKTTAVSYLCKVFTGTNPNTERLVEVIDFAAALKEFVIREFCPTWWTLDTIEYEKGTTLSCGKTVREVLQIVGTDWFRTLDPDYWVKKWKIAVLQSRAETILCADVRFPNEIRAVQSLGGKVIRFLRNPFPDDKHVSETALDVVQKTGEAFNAIMDNSDMSIAEQNLETAIWMQRWYPEFGPLFNGD